MTAVTPHLAYPLRLSGSSFTVVEQDLIDDVRQCVFLIARTELGARPLAPAVGIEDPTFTDLDPDVLAGQLEELEDRAVVTVTITPTNAAGEQDIEIAVALAAEGATVAGNVSVSNNGPIAAPSPNGPIDGGSPTFTTDSLLDGGSPLGGTPGTIDGGTP